MNNLIAVDFKKKRRLTEDEIKDKLMLDAGVLEDPVIRTAKSIARFNQMLILKRQENECHPRK